jgi:hypothetical protein
MKSNRYHQRGKGEILYGKGHGVEASIRQESGFTLKKNCGETEEVHAPDGCRFPLLNYLPGFARHIRRASASSSPEETSSCKDFDASQTSVSHKTNLFWRADFSG